MVFPRKKMELWWIAFDIEHWPRLVGSTYNSQTFIHRLIESMTAIVGRCLWIVSGDLAAWNSSRGRALLGLLSSPRGCGAVGSGLVLCCVVRGGVVTRGLVSGGAVWGGVVRSGLVSNFVSRIHLQPNLQRSAFRGPKEI